MRIVFTSFPAYGHLHPIMPLALAAQEQGDEVIVAIGPDLTDWVEASGLSAKAVGLSREDLAADAAAFEGLMQAGHMFTSVAIPPMLRDLVRLATDWKPDLLVHEEAEFTAPLAAHLLGIPCITHSWCAPARQPRERKALRSLLKPVWAEHTNSEVQVYGSVYLDACPPMFQSDAIDSIPGVRPLRAVLFDGPPTAPPAWLDKIEHPAAYVTFGTELGFSRPEVILSTVNAVSDVVATTVVTTGRNPADVVPPGGSSVFVAEYLPQSLLLPHVDLVVSHGGAGTTLGALLQGVPHVVLPQGAVSQLRNAERVEELGIGRHVDEALGESLESVLHDVLIETRYQENTKRVRDEILALPSPAAVVAELTGELV